MKILNETITSRNNSTVKWAASLSTKKGRDESKSFIAEGAKLTFEAIEANLPVTHIFIAESKKETYIEKINNSALKADDNNTEIIVVSDGAFDKISTEKAPQGIISVIKYLDFFRETDIIYKEEFFLSANERALILCSIRDPGNLGAIIRSAVAFGVDHIILTADSADLYNSKTVRSAMGSLFRVKSTIVSDINSCVNLLRECGRRVFAAELSDNAVSLADVGLLSSDVFVIGNEGHGIPTELSSACDGSVYIPISKKTESLNASIAAAIFMWEQGKLV